VTDLDLPVEVDAADSYNGAASGPVSSDDFSTTPAAAARRPL
jgi:hypothetical protein